MIINYEVMNDKNNEKPNYKPKLYIEDYEDIQKVYGRIKVHIPPKILSNPELSFNEKLILSLDYTYKSKRGFNMTTNIEVGILFGIHKNTVGNCRKQLMEKGYLVKDETDKRKYILTDKINNVEVQLSDKRVIKLPFEIYNHANLETGAKLLWGEYDSMSKGEQEYFSNRDYTSKRLNASKESITLWTKQLDENNLLEKYTHYSAYYKKIKIVKTRDLSNDIDNSDKD